MRLLIVSDMPHYKKNDSQIVGWGPTVQEIDHLARLFDEIFHIGFLYSGFPPESALPYVSSKVTFIPLQPSGGSKFRDKLKILLNMPSYFACVLNYLNQVDVLHVRCPSSIGLMLMILLPFLPLPRYRWFKYAGNWKPNGREPLAYMFQRLWLNLGWHRGVVTVNGHWIHQPYYVHSFLNPSLDVSDIKLGQHLSKQKEISVPIQILFVGRVETAKGCVHLLQIARRLQDAGVDFMVNIIGDGDERQVFERMALDMSMGKRIHFRGWLPHSALFQFYEKAHFLVLPTSASEGWPKVLGEAMAYGVVPVASDVSSIPQILTEFKVGRSLPFMDVDAFVDAILTYLSNPERWKQESQAGIEAARNFTYDVYLGRLKDMFKNNWGLELPEA
jgi:glycosyltransferase involved in cell wall biosynthesis